MEFSGLLDKKLHPIIQAEQQSAEHDEHVWLARVGHAENPRALAVAGARARFLLLGSGGGGTTTVLELALADPSAWPIIVYDLDELDPALPCLVQPSWARR